MAAGMQAATPVVWYGMPAHRPRLGPSGVRITERAGRTGTGRIARCPLGRRAARVATRHQPSPLDTTAKQAAGQEPSSRSQSPVANGDTTSAAEGYLSFSGGWDSKNRKPAERSTCHLMPVPDRNPCPAAAVRAARACMVRSSRSTAPGTPGARPRHPPWQSLGAATAFSRQRVSMHALRVCACLMVLGPHAPTLPFPPEGLGGLGRLGLPSRCGASRGLLGPRPTITFGRPTLAGALLGAARSSLSVARASHARAHAPLSRRRRRHAPQRHAPAHDSAADHVLRTDSVGPDRSSGTPRVSGPTARRCHPTSR